MSNLLLTETMLLIVTLIGALVLREFIKTKDGLLRKIMITYFSIEVFIYGSSMIYFYLADKGQSPIDIGIFRVIVLTPKVLVKLWLYYYLVKIHRKVSNN